MFNKASTDDRLSDTFAALADPTRRAILSRLLHGPSTVTELAEPFLGHMSLPAVTKHLKVLERAQLIKKSKDAQWRPCQLNPEALQFASAWLETYRSFFEAQLDRLDAYLKETAPKPQRRTTKRGVNHGKNRRKR